MGEPPGAVTIARFFKSANKNPSKQSLVREYMYKFLIASKSQPRFVARHSSRKPASNLRRRLELDRGLKAGHKRS